MFSQQVQDELLSEEIESCNACEGNQIPLPLQRLQKSIAESEHDNVLNETPYSLKASASLCTGEMYHYARVRGLHILERVLDTALSLVQKEQIQEASQVCLVK